MDFACTVVQMNSTLHLEAERFFHERIPITRAMGVRVVPDPACGFAIEAPVALNHNHLETAFGGSLNAVATLAGYGLLWMELRAENAHVVIASSSIRFLSPVRETIRAFCNRPTEKELQSFKTALREKGKARITLQVQIEEEAQIAAQFEAVFVALRNTK